MHHKYFATTCAVAAMAAPFTIVNAAENPFTDISSYSADTQQHILNLVDQKIINGKTPSTFAPSDEITRGQVVKMLGRFLVNKQITTIPSDWETTQYFSDLSLQTKDRELLKYAAVVKSTGIFNGKQDGTLDSSGTISRENMALVLDRATEAMHGKSLAEIAYYLEDSVLDIDFAKEEAREAIRALNALGISNVEEFNPKNTVKRVHFATFLSKAMEFMIPEITASELTIEANDFGFSSFTKVTSSNEAELDIEFTSTEITVSGEFAQYEIDTFFDWIDIEGTDLFGNEHFASIDLGLDDTLQLSPVIEFYDGAESIPAKAFLMDSFTSVTATSTNGQSAPKTTNFTNNGATYLIAKDTAVNEIIELDMEGIVKGASSTEDKIANDQVQYYIDFAGNIILNQSATNFTYDYRYYIAQSGDVIESNELDYWKLAEGRTFYYIPARFYTDWDVAAFQNDATIEEILAFHKTDGSKENFNFSASTNVLVIDEYKNIYGILDLGEYNAFFEKYTFELEAPFDLTDGEIIALGDLILEKGDNNKIIATAVGYDALDSIIMATDKDGNVYYYQIAETANGYQFVEVEEEEYLYAMLE